MSKFRWFLLIGISFAVIAFFTKMTYQFAEDRNYDPPYLIGHQLGTWFPVLFITLVFYLIAKRGRWETPSFLRWLGVVSLCFIPLMAILGIEHLRPETAEDPFAVYVYEVSELFIMGIVLILVTLGIKKDGTVKPVEPKPEETKSNE